MGYYFVDTGARDVFRAVAGAPELDVEMTDMQMSTCHIDRESHPFD